MQNRTLSLTVISLFASLTSIGAFIKIPLPVIPFTLQILFVFLAGCLLGSKKGMMSQLLYVGIGLIGIPVFASGGGPEYVLKPTFGYLIGFIVAAFVIGSIVEKTKEPKLKNFIFANVIGLIIVYILGITYVYISLNTWLDSTVSLKEVLMMGLVYSIGQDLLLAVFGGVLAVRLHSHFAKARENEKKVAA
ncbi:biotin biosynthesis protein BioY [Bacillus sp. FJAT-25509]|uniref:biotin transporter BioY n=1 Tax=Bacillaceae TaxID=186817 RepID=UPI0006F27EED|nr:biotin transporter BioY [Bacillus sp. FJAT-25509]KQL41334.1 biotin biosynthesis protein BioY [Bacillus sp. FJAT-25509]